MSPKPAADDPRIGAPSPADNPTAPYRPVPVPAARDGGPADRPTEPSGPAGSDEETAPGARVTPGRTTAGGTWVGIILGAVVLVFLLVFVLQNLQPVRVAFLGLQGTLPLGVWLLFAAVAGVLLLAIPGLGRLVQWRRAGRARSPRGAGRGRGRGRR